MVNVARGHTWSVRRPLLCILSLSVEKKDLSRAWEDAETVALVGDTAADHSFFPSDVSRSGYLNWNIRVLLFVGTQEAHISNSFLWIVTSSLLDAPPCTAEALRLCTEL
jgi:hypothetical protein